MANNRLFIGNKETLEYACLAKSYDEWGDIGENVSRLNKMLKTDNTWSKVTDLELFTESSDLYHKYVCKDNMDNEIK